MKIEDNRIYLPPDFELEMENGSVFAITGQAGTFPPALFVAFLIAHPQAFLHPWESATYG